MEQCRSQCDQYSYNRTDYSFGGQAVKKMRERIETATGDSSGYKVLEANRLNQGEPGEKTPTREEFKAMTYEQRVALKQKNEALYKSFKQ